MYIAEEVAVEVATACKGEGIDERKKDESEKDVYYSNRINKIDIK
jgi:hypothetical protein